MADQPDRDVVQVGSRDFQKYAGEWTANQTDLELIAAPGAGNYICIYDMVVSTGTAGTVLFEEGVATRLIGRVSLAANGGFVFNSARGLRLTANTSLTLTSTTGAGPLSVIFNYAILP